MHRNTLFAGCLVIAGLVPPPLAAAEAPVVVELFTSQSCYSCPPAEAFLAGIAGRDDVLALEFHVDYWNTLVYGFAGRWEDPFSKPEHTQRQRAYNVAIRSSGQVYTPQAIIEGRDEVIGSHTGTIESLIRRHAGDTRSRIAVAVARTAADRLEIRLGDSPRLAAEATGTAVWLVRFLRHKTTQVPSGENKGKTLVSAHVVTDMRQIGTWPGDAATLPVDGVALGDNEDCAILVQSAATGPVLGAARCPAPPS